MSRALIAVAILGAAIFAASKSDAKLKEEMGPFNDMQMTPQEVFEIIKTNNSRLGNKFGANSFMDLKDVLAICYQESFLRPNVIRTEPDGRSSYGLMQILDSTAADMGFTGPVVLLYDPEENIYYGMKYLIWINDYLKKRLGYNPTKAMILSAYNGGVGNVLAGWSAFAYVASWENFRGMIA